MEVSENDRQDVLHVDDRASGSLEERIARLEAKERILEMMMEYSHYCDVGDWDRVCALYTDDVERVLTGTLSERVRGRDKIHQLYLNPVLPRREDGKSVTRAANMTVRHFVGTPVVRLAPGGRQAFVTSYFTLLESKEDERGFARSAHEGSYIFTFVKQGDDWKIQKMVVETEIAHDPFFRPQ
jgi:ketosteroid isomerase-like protein